MIARQIKLSSKNEISIKWDDGHDSIIKIRTLRDQCPCAGCKGETVLLKVYEPIKQTELPGKYIIADIQKVGHYAVQIYWKDGHTTGIYTWEYLRDLCECKECLEKRTNKTS